MSYRIFLFLFLLPMSCIGQNFFHVIDDVDNVNERAINLEVDGDEFYVVNEYDDVGVAGFYKFNLTGDVIWNTTTPMDAKNYNYLVSDDGLVFITSDIPYATKLLKTTYLDKASGEFSHEVNDSIAIPDTYAFNEDAKFSVPRIYQADGYSVFTTSSQSSENTIGKVGLFGIRSDEQIHFTVFPKESFDPKINYIGLDNCAYGEADRIVDNSIIKITPTVDSLIILDVIGAILVGGGNPFYSKTKYKVSQDRLFSATEANTFYPEGISLQTSDINNSKFNYFIKAPLDVNSERNRNLIDLSAIAKCENGDFLVLGIRSSNVDESIWNVVWRLNKDCELIWEHEITASNVEDNDQLLLNTIGELSSGDIVMGGSLGSSSMALLSLTSEGYYEGNDDSILVDDFLLSADISDVSSCYGDATGIVDLDVRGGVEPLTYELVGSHAQDSAIFNNLTGGEYDFKVNDAIGKVVELSVRVDQPGILNVTHTITEYDLNLSVFGGFGGKEYSIDGGLNFHYRTNFSNLWPGFYEVLIRDNSDCDYPPYEVEVPYIEMDIISTITQDLPCVGDTNGTIELQVTGGIEPYQYELLGSHIQEEPVFENLSAGVHVFSITDAFDVTETVFVDLDDPSSITVFIDVQSEDLEVSAIGGAGGYTYSIDGGQTFNQSGIFDNLVNGDYEVVVMDANGCLSEIVVVNVLNPWNSIQALYTPSCFGMTDGRIVMIVDGVYPPFSYQLDDGPLQDSRVFEDLEPGVYEVTITDSEGNQEFSSVEVGETRIEITITFFDNDTIEVTESGGLQPYMYSINNGFSFQSSALFPDLDDGTYEVVVKDRNDCVSEPETVTVGMTSSTTDLDTESHISIFPNPTTGLFTIDPAQELLAPIQIEVVNAVGQVTFFRTLEHDEETYQLDLRHLESGIYILKLSDVLKTRTVSRFLYLVD